MPHDPHLLSTAAWLIKMADNPLTSGSKGHAAYRLAELMASHPMYRVLRELIRELRALPMTSAAALANSPRRQELRPVSSARLVSGTPSDTAGESARPSRSGCAQVRTTTGNT